MLSPALDVINHAGPAPTGAAGGPPLAPADATSGSGFARQLQQARMPTDGLILGSDADGDVTGPALDEPTTPEAAAATAAGGDAATLLAQLQALAPPRAEAPPAVTLSSQPDARGNAAAATETCAASARSATSATSARNGKSGTKAAPDDDQTTPAATALTTAQAAGQAMAVPIDTPLATTPPATAAPAATAARADAPAQRLSTPARRGTVATAAAGSAAPRSVADTPSAALSSRQGLAPGAWLDSSAAATMAGVAPAQQAPAADRADPWASALAPATPIATAPAGAGPDLPAAAAAVATAAGSLAPAPAPTPAFTATPAAEASLPTPPQHPGFAAQLGERLCTFVRQGVEHARLHLNPTEMGPVTVRIQLDGLAAQVHLTAEQAVTRQALEQALPQLASNLREAGLTLAGGGVYDQPAQPDGGGRERPGERPAAGARDGAAEGGAPAALPAAAPSLRRRGVVDLVA